MLIHTFSLYLSFAGEDEEEDEETTAEGFAHQDPSSGTEETPSDTSVGEEGASVEERRSPNPSPLQPPQSPRVPSSSPSPPTANQAKRKCCLPQKQPKLLFTLRPVNSNGTSDWMAGHDEGNPVSFNCKSVK